MKLEITDKEYELILRAVCETWHLMDDRIEQLKYQKLHLELATGEKNLPEIEAYRKRKSER